MTEVLVHADCPQLRHNPVLPVDRLALVKERGEDENHTVWVCPLCGEVAYQMWTEITGPGE